MASPLVRRQISFPPLFSTVTSRTSPPNTTPPPAISTTTTGDDDGSFPSIISDVSSLFGPIFSSRSSLSQSIPSPELTPTLLSSITSSLSTVSSVSPTPTPSLLTGSDGPITVTETTSATAPPSTGTSESKGKSFLENKPLAGTVFGLVGLVVLIIMTTIVVSFMRRRNQRRLLADASNFSFDPKDVEDRMSVEEKNSRSGLVGHSDYTSDNGAAGGFAGLGMGGVSRPGPSHSPPMHAYIPQDYPGYDGVYPVQYHNLSNVPVGHNPTPNPYDMYDPRNGGGYSNGQGQHDPYNLPDSSGDRLPMSDPGPLVPYQLQPGVHPAQGSTFAPLLSKSPPPLNRSPQIPLTTSPPLASLQPPAPSQYNIPRLPTPGALPDSFGRRESVDDEAYGGAFLGHVSPPPGQRTLQVANM
ncbi:hypothetical protein BDM02DRAFT_3119827 [Thelephora ganbajun]|uniref:Uncharacterized protein n=1 Tax=Thelephora ganbajun TaxID=370292 RepID=A0ACB6Z819_THEGA|nr:hypothetical protein BDM02DRAFT_3119827 [Thelephora ganbajun]